MSDNVKPLVSDNIDARYIQALGMHYSERKRKAGILLTNYHVWWVLTHKAISFLKNWASYYS